MSPCGQCLADDDEKYAHPDGEDEYGPRYEEREVPTSLREVLDEQGRYTIPSFIDLTIRRGELECWVVDQIPAPSTLVTCPQTVNVELYYTCDGNDEYMARLPIELVDVTPPSLDVALDSNVNSQTTFGGVARFVTPTAVLPIIDVEDSCDANPTVEVYLNGEEYVLGTPVTDFGHYALVVSATDDYDNVVDSIIVFEIRERSSHNASAVVEDTNWELAPDGQSATFSARLLIADDEFDHHDIYLKSVRMLLRDGNGKVMAAQGPISIDPIDICFLSAEINECYVAVEFEELIEGPPPLNSPTSLDIFGVGIDQQAIAFEWGARIANVEVQNPVQVLMGQVGGPYPCTQPAPPPPPPPPPPCVQVNSVISNPASCSIPWIAGGPPAPQSCGAGSGTMSRAFAWVGGLGASNTIANSVCPSAVGCNHPGSGCLVGGPIAGSLVVVATMVGNCCNCSFQIDASGTVRGCARHSGTGVGHFGSASASGQITFAAPCGSITFPAPPVNTVTANHTTPSPLCTPWPGNLNCTDANCTSMLIIETQVQVKSDAVATCFQSDASTATNWARWIGNVHEWSIVGTATPCPPPNPCEE